MIDTSSVVPFPDRGRRRPTVFITVSTPWSIRNYFQTPVVRRLAEDCDVVAFVTPAMRAALVRDGHDALVELVELPFEPEPHAWRISRQLRKKLYMELRRADTEAIWDRYGARPLHQRIAGRLIAAATSVVRGPRAFEAISRLDLRVNRSERFRALFEARKPAVLFATNANSRFEDSILRSALAAGVPAALMVLSWDHLSTKVVLSPAYERLLVWTEGQRGEVLSTYPWFDADDVVPVGIPHFDAYFEKPRQTREQWCARYGLDPARRTIVYMSMPQVRHGEQHVVMEALAREIEQGGTLPRDLQLLIKCHPFDDNSKYESIVERYEHVALHRTTLEPGGDPLTWLPEPNEIEQTRDAIAYADVTVNIYSTVTIEAALLDKPIVHVAFDPGPLPPGRIPCREYYNFTHFRPVVESGASVLAHDQDELHRLIAEALANPALRREQRRALAAEFAGPGAGSTDRVVDTIRGLFAGAPAAGADRSFRHRARIEHVG